MGEETKEKGEGKKGKNKEATFLHHFNTSVQLLYNFNCC